MGRRQPVQRTYSIDNKIAEKFEEQTPSRKTSHKLEELMAEYIDEEASVETPQQKLPDLTPAQEQLLDTIHEYDLYKSPLPKINKMVQGEKGVYSSKKRFKNGINSLAAKYPLRIEKGDLKPNQVECESCDASQPFSLLVKEGGNCGNCGDKIFKLPKSL